MALSESSCKVPMMPFFICTVAARMLSFGVSISLPKSGDCGRMQVRFLYGAEQKSGWLTADERVRALRALYNRDARVRVESYRGLTTDYARSIGATAILRGVRSMKDFEYEQQIADINRRLTGIETLCLFTDPALGAISSSVVRELAHFGKDISAFLPEGYEPQP